MLLPTCFLGLPGTGLIGPAKVTPQPPMGLGPCLLRALGRGLWAGAWAEAQGGPLPWPAAHL